jgi:hypothetical protein
MTRARFFLAACLVLACACACEDFEEKSPLSELHATLDLDIRDKAVVDLAINRDDIDAKIRLTKGFGVAPENSTLEGIGHVERFPEANLTLYTARFTTKGASDGPCADDFVSLALALHQRGNEPRLSGSLTAYCGAYTWHGIPARNPLRLATPPPVEE